MTGGATVGGAAEENTGAAGRSTTGGGAAGGATTRGGAGGTSAAGGTGAAGVTVAGGAAASGGAAGGGASATGVRGVTGDGAPCWRMARSTSPGLAMCERSILVRSSSSPARACPGSFPAGAWAWAAKCCRTFSASSGSIELEWVFFSATPMVASTSRTSLLLTSSSLARSLIRIFGCIRPVSLRNFR